MNNIIYIVKKKVKEKINPKINQLIKTGEKLVKLRICGIVYNWVLIFNYKLEKWGCEMKKSIKYSMFIMMFCIVVLFCFGVRTEAEEKTGT